VHRYFAAAKPRVPASSPSSIHLYLPVALPPGPHPFVLDQADIWVFCDTAPVGGVPFEAKVTGSTLVRADIMAGDTARAGSDTEYLWPNLRVSSMSTAVASLPRTENATVEIHAGSGVVTLPVVVTVTNAPFLHTSETTQSFRIPGDALSQSLPIWFPNPQTALSATTAGNAGWLSVSPGRGTGYTDLNVSVNTAGLSAGDYFSSVVLTSPDAINSPLQIPVRMTVVPLSIWSQRQSLEFSQAAGGLAPAPQSLAILTSGSQPPVSFTLKGDSAWLSASPSTGTTPAQISVSVNGRGFAAATYHGNLIASAPNATSLIVPIKFTVSPANYLRLSPQDFNFFYWPGISMFDRWIRWI
jgi:hypothetical protein